MPLKPLLSSKSNPSSAGLTKVSPFILGSGRAAQALTEAWAILGIAQPEIKIDKPVKIQRGQPIPTPSGDLEYPVLCVANPPGLHARAILDGSRAGYKLIVVEKPACVSLREIETLAPIETPVAVCHVYRQMWGIQTLKRMIISGEMGDLIAIEGRYWQSSTAQRVVGERAGGGWKNDPVLSGPHDALLDVGTHWADAAIYLAGEPPGHVSVWLSHANAETAHRDSHVQLAMEFPRGLRTFSSISKTVHGASNHFEINVLGTKKSATWKFLEPDLIEVGVGSSRTILSRKDEIASKHPAFHGLGWVDGYLNIFSSAVRRLRGDKGADYPTLAEHLTMLKALLQAAR